MATYVLVHGAWSGAHCFRLVRPLLQRAGHTVFTPSLTGVGERVHLTSPSVDLSMHVRDVVNMLLYEDLTHIVLLGYSYGGFVVTGALEYVAQRVKHLVYLDAFVPKDGDCVLQLAGFQRPNTIALGEPWLVPPTPREYDDPQEAAFSNARRVPQPGATFIEPVRLRQPLEDFPFTRTYIKATAEAPETAGGKAFWASAAHAKSSPAWRYREVATSHMVPNNRPAELADLLLELA